MAVPTSSFLQLTFVVFVGFVLKNSSFGTDALPRNNNQSLSELLRKYANFRGDSLAKTQEESFTQQSFTNDTEARISLAKKSFVDDDDDADDDADDDDDSLYDQLLIRSKAKHCHRVMVQLARHASNFTHCLIAHSRPYRVCEKCVKHYTRFQAMYKHLQEDGHCVNMLLMSDTMRSLHTMQEEFSRVWDSAHCYTCFDVVEQNSTTGHVFFNLTEEADNFIKMAANVSSCFSKYPPVMCNVSKACQTCKAVYMKMKTAFHSLKDTTAEGQICMDLFDRMNMTWLTWSRGLRCPSPHARPAAVWVIGGVVLMITAALFILTRMFVESREFKIHKPKRMKIAKYLGRYELLSSDAKKTTRESDSSELLLRRVQKRVLRALRQQAERVNSSSVAAQLRHRQQGSWPSYGATDSHDDVDRNEATAPSLALSSSDSDSESEQSTMGMLNKTRKTRPVARSAMTDIRPARTRRPVARSSIEEDWDDSNYSVQ